MDGAVFGGVHRAGFVHRVADDVDDAAEHAFADRRHDRIAGIGHFLAAHQSFGHVHRDGPHGEFAEMLGDFEHQAVAVVSGFQRVEDRRQVPSKCTSTTAPMTWVIRPTALSHWMVLFIVFSPQSHSASAPEMISISSLVICAWRVRL